MCLVSLQMGPEREKMQSTPLKKRLHDNLVKCFPASVVKPKPTWPISMAKKYASIKKSDLTPKT